MSAVSAGTSCGAAWRMVIGRGKPLLAWQARLASERDQPLVASSCGQLRVLSLGGCKVVLVQARFQLTPDIRPERNLDLHGVRGYPE